MPYRVSLVAGQMDLSPVNSQSQVEIKQFRDGKLPIRIKLLQGDMFPDKELHAAAVALQQYLLEDRRLDHAFIYVSNDEYELKVPTGSTAFAFVCQTLYEVFWLEHKRILAHIQNQLFDVSSNKDKFRELSQQLVREIGTDTEEHVLRYKFGKLIDSMFCVNSGVTRKTTIDGLLAWGRCVDKLLTLDASWAELSMVKSCLYELKNYNMLGATVIKEQVSELHDIVERIESFMPSAGAVVDMQTVARATQVGLFSARHSGPTNTGSDTVEEDVDDERKVAGLGAKIGGSSRHLTLVS